MKLKNFLFAIFSGRYIKKIKPGDIITVAIAAVMVGILVVPSVTTALKNDKAKKCNSWMYVLMENLAPRLYAEDAGGEWHNMIFCGEQERALELLAAEARIVDGWNIDPSDYYFVKENNILYIRCTEHSDNKNRKLVLGNNSYGAGYSGVQGMMSNTQRKIFDINSHEKETAKPEEESGESARIFKQKREAETSLFD